MIAVLSNRRITPAERRLSEQLRPRFLGALGRSGKTPAIAAAEMGIPVNAMTTFSAEGTLPQEALDAVEKWIAVQRTDLTLARVKCAPKTRRQDRKTL